MESSKFLTTKMENHYTNEEMKKVAELLFPEAKPKEYWEEKYPSRELPAGAKVTRFAPSPTGFLHVGGVMMALLDRAEAQRSGGVFILRLEDTDQSRSVEGAEESIYEGLRWIDIVPNESSNAGGNYGPYRQSERVEMYHTFAKELIKTGHAYPCFCTEEELKTLRAAQEMGGGPRMYPGTCRVFTSEEIETNIKAGKPCTIRLRVPHDEVISWHDLAKREPLQWETKHIDDQVLLKSDQFPTYHLANVVDDHFMGVNRVYRGEEWISSTPKHLLLYRFLGWQAPEFAHLVLLRKSQSQKKLSKREGEAGLEWYRDEGYLPEAVRNFLTRIIWAHPKDLDVYPHEDFIQGFDVAKMGDSAPQVDLKLLDHINQAYVAHLSPEERLARIQEWAQTRDHDFSRVLHAHPEAVKFFSIEPERLKKLSEARANFGFYFDELYTPPAGEELAKETEGKKEHAQTALEKYLSVYHEGDPHEVWEQKIRAFAKEVGLKDKNMFMLIRLAVVGSRFSPPLYEIMEALGKEKVMARLLRTAELQR